MQEGSKNNVTVLKSVSTYCFVASDETFPDTAVSRRFRVAISWHSAASVPA